MRQPHPGQLEIRDHDAGQRPAPAWPQHCAAGLWKVKTSNTTSLHVWGGKGVKPQIPYRYSLVFVSWWYLISSRIGPLSDALGDLYKEFNALKERLGDLTVKFDDVEAFVDDVRAGRSPALPRREPRPPAGKPVEENATNTEERRRPPGRRTRVVVRRIKKPAGSWAPLIRRKWKNKINYETIMLFDFMFVWWTVDLCCLDEMNRASGRGAIVYMFVIGLHGVWPP